MNAIEILIDRGFMPSSDLGFVTDNGISYSVGYNARFKSQAAIVALIEDEECYLLDKPTLSIMAESARTQGVKTVTLYTNYGVELHSRYEKPETVGLDRIIKVNTDGFNSK